MTLDKEKLQKILSIEAADGFQNRKVYRGLAAFVTNWTQAALRANLKPAEAALVEQVSQQLTDYAEYTVPQRQAALEKILTLLG